MKNNFKKTLVFALLSIVTIAWAGELFAAENKIAKPAVKVQPAVPKPQYGGILKLSDMTDGANIGLPARYSPVYAQR